MTMSSSSQFFAALASRRSVYALKAASPIPDEAIREIVEKAINLSPTAYNSQTSRVALVLGDKNKKMWDALWVENQKTFPDAEMEATQRTKWESAYLSSYGAVVFFDDKAALGAWVEKMPNRKEALGIWSKNGQGILQHVIWTALATEGLGANLQHFTQVTPGADEALRTIIDVPAEWEVVPCGEPIMPFGEIVESPAQKPKLPIEQRLKVFN